MKIAAFIPAAMVGDEPAARGVLQEVADRLGVRIIGPVTTHMLTQPTITTDAGEILSPFPEAQFGPQSMGRVEGEAEAEWQVPGILEASDVHIITAPSWTRRAEVIALFRDWLLEYGRTVGEHGGGREYVALYEEAQERAGKLGLPWDDEALVPEELLDTIRRAIAEAADDGAPPCL